MSYHNPYPPNLAPTIVVKPSAQTSAIKIALAIIALLIALGLGLLVLLLIGVETGPGPCVFGVLNANNNMPRDIVDRGWLDRLK